MVKLDRLDTVTHPRPKEETVDWLCEAVDRLSAAVIFQWLENSDLEFT